MLLVVSPGDIKLANDRRGDSDPHTLKKLAELRLNILSASITPPFLLVEVPAPVTVLTPAEPLM